MFPLNTILAWSINIIMNKKYDNNNIIIASRAYFLQLFVSSRSLKLEGVLCIYVLLSIKDKLKTICMFFLMI
jgi:hypothetical protein